MTRCDGGAAVRQGSSFRRNEELLADKYRVRPSDFRKSRRVGATFAAMDSFEGLADGGDEFFNRGFVTALPGLGTDAGRPRASEHKEYCRRRTTSLSRPMMTI